MRYFVELSYKGTAYFGWQKQPQGVTIQQTLEKAFSTILRTTIELTGAGRTDTGVHASYYVAHFDTDVDPQKVEQSVYHINSVLPGDIAVHRITRVPDSAHARFDALQREYTYRITSAKNPFTEGLAWYCRYGLDLQAMNLAASYLISAEDFTTFSKLHSVNKTNICDVRHARWHRQGEELIFTIRADRFLRNMIRSIVGTLADVGRGKITADEFGRILACADRSRASGSAPACGLYLSDVVYDHKILTKN